METSPQDSPIGSSSPRLTRILGVLLCIATLLANTPGIKKSVVDNFALLPVATVGQSKLWNVVTAGFFDTNIAAAVVNLALIFTTGKWIETSWGSRSIFLYIFIVNTLSAISTYIALLIAYVITQADTFFFTPIGTTNGICAALLVAIKQLIPEHEIGVSSINVPANFLPLIYILIVLILTIASFFSIGTLFLTCFAFQLSWLYLRYFRFSSGSYGDVSDTFAYQTLFPNPLRPAVSILANLGYLVFKPVLNIAHRSGQTQPRMETPDDNTSPKTSTMETERRRQRALKVLDERLQAASDENEQNQVSEPPV